MPVILLSIAMLIISIIFKLAAVFRLTIPLLYVVAMNTFWRSWYQAHQSLGDIIFFVLLGLVCRFHLCRRIRRYGGRLPRKYPRWQRKSPSHLRQCGGRL